MNNYYYPADVNVYDWWENKHIGHKWITLYYCTKWKGQKVSS